MPFLHQQQTDWAEHVNMTPDERSCLSAWDNNDANAAINSNQWAQLYRKTCFYTTAHYYYSQWMRKMRWLQMRHTEGPARKADCRRRSLFWGCWFPFISNLGTTERLATFCRLLPLCLCLLGPFSLFASFKSKSCQDRKMGQKTLLLISVLVPGWWSLSDCTSKSLLEATPDRLMRSAGINSP